MPVGNCNFLPSLTFLIHDAAGLNLTVVITKLIIIIRRTYILNNTLYYFELYLANIRLANTGTCCATKNGSFSKRCNFLKNKFGMN